MSTATDIDTATDVISDAADVAADILPAKTEPDIGALIARIDALEMQITQQVALLVQIKDQVEPVLTDLLNNPVVKMMLGGK